MKSNPIATPTQHALERRALELLREPRIEAARAELHDEWLRMAKPSQDQRRCFESSFEEVMFCATVWSLVQDAERPEIATITRLAHRVGDTAIPGSRYGVDNPDSVYRVIPIDGAERYVIRGRVAERRLTENHFTLWDAAMNTVDTLSGNDLVLGEDRRFEITVDADPANGRPNHIRSSPAAREFFIRDVLLDWARDEPNELSIERLGDVPRMPARSDAEQIEATLALMRAWVENSLRWNRQALDESPNSLSFTIDRETDGALRNQLYVMGYFDLADDEAMILDVHTGGARYFIAPITNLWGTSNEIVHRTSCLNSHQSAANPDGTLSYVVSLEDPGVHNWLDPCDMRDGFLTLRWAEFPGGTPSAQVRVESRVVPHGRLREELPRTTRWVTPEERRAQLAERARSYAWRLQDH
ncbi:MAG: hypothetical protein JRG86_10520 [Deltaproteobacteria bacterium]|nr:hypothetical protein [Deltaproteobacteria bacterium]